MAFDGRILAGVGVLTAIVEGGSFVKGAELLGLTASGVSRAISRLEVRLGVRLLDRTTRSVSLTDEGERELMRTAAQYPRLVLQAAEAHEPHRVAFFAHELATRFHAHWNRGKDTRDLRFVNENDRKLSYSRLSLVAGVGLVLASALSILGVSAPEEMR